MSFEIGDRVVFWAEQDGFSVRLEGTIETINESTYCIEAEIDGRYETFHNVSPDNIVAWDQAEYLGLV